MYILQFQLTGNNLISVLFLEIDVLCNISYKFHKF
jgi:hypothetical protein